MYIWSQLLIDDWQAIYTSVCQQQTILEEFKLNKEFNVFISQLHKKREDFDNISDWYHEFAKKEEKSIYITHIMHEQQLKT